MFITIPFSKTDQFGQSTTLVLQKGVNDTYCPVTLMLDYISIRSELDGPLFCHLNNKCLTRYQFSKMLKNSLSFIGYCPSEFNTHSLRIGAATQASINGDDEATIMSKGRWKSSVYKRYIRVNLI